MANITTGSAAASYVMAAQRLFPEDAVPILDRLTAQPLCFYSHWHKTRAAYTGKPIKVRRASDNALADIAFTGNVLDVAALDAHCTTSNGFIHTLYDQKGALDLTQATDASQPQIWDGAKRDFVSYSRDTNLGIAIPLLKFDGSNDFMSYVGAIGLTGNPALTVAMVATNSTVNGHFVAFGDTANAANKALGLYAQSSTQAVAHNNSGFRTLTATALTALSRHVITRAAAADANATVWRQNAAALAQDSSGAGTPALEDETLVLGANSASAQFGATTFGMLGIFASDYSAVGQATDLATLEAWMKSAHPGSG